ncbi:MAG: dihydrofolate reductase family protein [Deltaproteobacteria bacterium]|nr:dihydrofolate reductase family protein [Deltaproteobacteria bacterium]
MSQGSRVRVYLACSLDGYIAGPDDDLAWLSDPSHADDALAPEAHALGFAAFMQQVGAIVMGRTTYDVVAQMGHWVYGDTPVIVASSRTLAPVVPTVTRGEGDLAGLIARAKSLAEERDVYLDGGTLVRQALDAGLVDELTITWVPTLLTAGTRLFDGLRTPRALRFVSHASLGGGMVQVTAVVRGD